jgi:hypothetical protein
MMKGLTYIDIILSIDDNTSIGQMSFNLVKGLKSKEYVDGTVFMAREWLKTKFKAFSASSLMKMEIYYINVLRNSLEPEILLTELE